MTNSRNNKTHGFESLAGEWLEMQKTHLKPSSIAKYSNILKNHLFPYFGVRDITSITRKDIRDFVKNSRHLSPKTVNSMISVLKCIFKYVEREKNLVVADTRDICLRQSHPVMRILSRSEQHNLTNYLVNNINPCNLGILLSLYTGLRIGELCALKWEDISFNEHVIYVHSTMQRIQISGGKTRTQLMIYSPKSDFSVRRIPIPDTVYRLLLTMRKDNDSFLLEDGDCLYIEPRCMENRFKEVLSKCEIEAVHFHTLRHTFATRCVELGFDVKSLSEILGHSNVSITLNRYVHPSMELKRENMNMLDTLFAE